MMTEEFRESITEVLDILSCMDKKYAGKVPDKFMNFLEENKSETYKANLDYSKKINEMDLKQHTKSILTMMYLYYWSDDKQGEEIEPVDLIEKKEFGETYNEEIFENKMFKAIKRASKINKIKQMLIDDIINDLFY